MKSVGPGGEVTTHTDGYSFTIMRACDWSMGAVKYDPASAKKRLAGPATQTTSIWGGAPTWWSNL
ncbi:MAG: hypothetical protein VYE18_06055 [Pseudomonadota bacterium]|nr:hypothetical protein [Pseudomonadota bacterium]